MSKEIILQFFCFLALPVILQAGQKDVLKNENMKMIEKAQGILAVIFETSNTFTEEEREILKIAFQFGKKIPISFKELDQIYAGSVPVPHFVYSPKKLVLPFQPLDEIYSTETLAHILLAEASHPYSYEKLYEELAQKFRCSPEEIEKKKFPEKEAFEIALQFQIEAEKRSFEITAKFYHEALKLGFFKSKAKSDFEKLLWQLFQETEKIYLQKEKNPKLWERYVEENAVPAALFSIFND